MSKINGDLLDSSIKDLLAFSSGEEIKNPKEQGKMLQGKKRKFQETVDLQCSLKNYDPKRRSVSPEPSSFLTPLAPTSRYACWEPKCTAKRPRKLASKP